MKVNGRKLDGPREIIVPVIRDEKDGGTLFFIVNAVTDMEPFKKLCPFPIAPKIQLPGNRTKEDVEDPGYKAQVAQWWRSRAGWMFIESLRKTNIEWETFDINDPMKFPEAEEELRKSGLSDAELGRILAAIMDVNSLSESLVEEARQRFLTDQATQPKG